MVRFIWQIASCVGLLGFSSVSLAADAVTGINAGVNNVTGERPFRLNLKDFESSGPAFDLYIQALQQFQAEDQSELQSWYEICGIHGYPYRAWDGVNGTRQSGYCTHDSVLFPPWHRPYLALFEQIIWNKAQTIAASYPAETVNKYLSAASSLRIPYWDWASDPTLPNSLVSPQINITTPAGPRLVDNPLFNYTFHPLPVGTDIPPNDPLVNYTSTVRSPNSAGQSQNNVVQQLMKSNGAYLRSSTYQLLSSETNYTVFSTQSLKDRGRNYNNLESIHGTIHALTGNGGHMSYIPWSGFDPIFWLHHCNVDRLFAIWQAINPDSYVEAEPNEDGTFMEPPGTIETVDTPLWPFRTISNTFWTSTSSRSTRAFGYTYPEVVDWNVDAKTLANNVRAKVNELYNPNPNASTTNRRSTGTGEHTDVSKRGLLSDISEIVGEKFAELGINNLNKQWVINIRVDKHALGRSFQIHFFYGNPPEDASTWGYAPNLIGTYGVFAGPSPDAPSRISYGQVSLSPILANAMSSGILADLAAPLVIPLLTQNLEWRVTDVTGCEVDPQEIVDKGGLEIFVASRDVEPLSSGQEHLFPKHGTWQLHKEPTLGKIGGVSDLLGW